MLFKTDWYTSNQLYTKMNGPFTCEQLRTIRQSAIEHEFVLYTNSIVDNIKQAILDKAIGDVSDPRQAIGVPHKNSQDRLPPTQYSVQIGNLQPVRGYPIRMIHLFNRKAVVDTVLTKLRDVFPDMKIMVDPLNTYILFDWA